ncbi:TetR/AcrR family transcriptional regulator [Ochrobactrum sp. EDr1-4]|uniref:TetR/AcrR family transcriptional regulator n=1 Tax=Ochrobactrum sp. EDr1-4 TaxID=3368622 RepID=UPI003B9E1DB3
MPTREKILHLTNELIQTKGYNGFSYADISKEIGFNKASIHYHFKSKSVLGIAYCSYKKQAFQELEQLIIKEKNGLERLKLYINAFKLCALKGQTCGAFSMIINKPSFDGELQDAVSKLAELELKIISDILHYGIESGDIKANGISIGNLAIIVNSAVKGALTLNNIPNSDAFDKVSDALIILLKK